MSDKPRNTSKDDSIVPDFLSDYNPAKATIGTGLLVTQGPAAAKSMSAGSLYHGTDTDNISGIMEEGISTEYAGRNRRINAMMMENALIEMADDKADIGGEGIAELADRLDKKTNARMRGGKYQGDYARDIIDETKSFLNEKGVDVDESTVDKYVKQRGKRNYFGWGPHSVTDWASTKGEGQIAVDNVQDFASKGGTRQILEQTGDMLTGGLYGAVKDEAIPYSKYQDSLRKADTVTGDVAKEIAKTEGDNLGTVLKVSPSAKNMKTFDAFSDFPGLQGLMGGSYSLKDSIKNYLPNWSPGRDLSTASDIKPSQIQEAHLVDKGTGKVIKQIKNQAYSSPGRLKAVGQGLRRSAMPLALTAAGIEAATQGFTGEGIASRAYDHFIDGKEKTGSMKSRVLKKTIKPALVGASISIPAAIGTGYLRKKVKEKNMPIPDTVSQTGGAGARTSVSLSGLASLKPQEPIEAASTGVGITTGQMGSQLGIEKGSAPTSSIVTDNENVNQVAGPLEAGAIGGAIAGVPTYVANRYYPKQVHQGKKMIGPMLKALKPKYMAGGAGLTALGTGLLAGGLGYGVSKSDTISNKLKSFAKITNPMADFSEKEGNKSFPLNKISGGPGSGVSYNNTKKIDYDSLDVKKSDTVSLHNRKNMKRGAYSKTVDNFSLDKIDYVAQDKIVVPKLGWFLENVGEWKSDPIEVLKKDDEYHLLDGHHRFVAGKRKERSTHPAKVYTRSQKEGSISNDIQGSWQSGHVLFGKSTCFS